LHENRVPHLRVVKNVTILLDEPVADWARIEAAKRRTSVSRMVGENRLGHRKQIPTFVVEQCDYGVRASQPVRLSPD
jgi:hypothetical protein